MAITDANILVNTIKLTVEQVEEVLRFFVYALPEDYACCIHLLANEDEKKKEICEEYCEKYSFFQYETGKNMDQLKVDFYPYHCYESNLEFWKLIFSKMNPLPISIYNSFVFDLLWKIEANVIWPYHYAEDRLAIAKDEYIQMLNEVPDELIRYLEGIDNFQRYHLFKLKTSGGTATDVWKEKLRIVRNGVIFYEANKIEIVLTKFRLTEKKIKFVAFVKSPAFAFASKPELYMDINGNQEDMIPVKLSDSSWNYYKTKELSNQFYTFVLDIDINEIKQFHFYVKLDEKLFDTYYYFMPEVIFSNAAKRYRCYYKDIEVRFTQNTFYIDKVTKEAEKEYYDYVSKQFEETEPEVFEFRNRVWEEKKHTSNVWLYYDCKGVYKDNGYYQFIHDFEKKDGVKKYYVVNGDVEEKKELFTKEQLKYVVTFGSQRHKELFNMADKIITAYIERGNYNPYPVNYHVKIMDCISQPEIIYLQHGVYHAFIPWKYSLDRLQVDKKVVSTDFEKKNDLKRYNFTEDYLLPVGMPRYDFFDLSQKPEKKILYAPSWRKYLVDMENGEWVTNEEKFKQSNFYKNTKELLENSRLKKTLLKKDYVLEFKLHPILMRYAHLYELDGEVIRFANQDVKEEEYAAFITDFSSYVYDFAYLKRKIIFFFPDYDEFKSGMSDYRECVLSFEDGIGDFANQVSDAVAIIEKSVKTKCIAKDEQLQMMKDMFIFSSGECREKIYNGIVDGE